MNKVWLIVRQEFSNRVKKKSFLITTILLPLLFPAIGSVMVYLAITQNKEAKTKHILVIDEGGVFKDDNSLFNFISIQKTLEEGKKQLSDENIFGLLYLPPFELSNPKGITFYTKISPSPNDISKIESIIRRQIKNLKMKLLNIDKELLNKLDTKVSVQSVTISDGGGEKNSSAKVLFGVGMTAGILIYFMIFIYGAQIMQSIIEEKMSKVIELIISTVRPFQLMLGKIIGMASVGLLQFTIWVLIVFVFTSFGIGWSGSLVSSTALAETNTTHNLAILEILKSISEISWFYVLSCFIFYFIGGYLLYGSLIAAVGSAVDSPAEAQQFMFPITIPMLISYFALFIFILEDPHSSTSVWFSLIPFTSPIAMVGRIGFDVPTWQLLLSMMLLICGFVITTWFAGRIYRVGILMHGTKVGYKVLLKWFFQRV